VAAKGEITPFHAQEHAATRDVYGACIGTFEEDFWKYANPVSNGCWLWSGPTMPNGYGRLNRRGDYRLAHRLSYEIHHGPIPTGGNILHKCDVKNCVRPDHLYVGTHVENARDILARGGFNHRRGEQHPGAKLLDADVAEIRKRHAEGGLTYTALGAEYGVDPTTIARIVQGKRRLKSP
jgi:hypothetical protein